MYWEDARLANLKRSARARAVLGVGGEGMKEPAVLALAVSAKEVSADLHVVL